MSSFIDQGMLTHWLASMAVRTTRDEFLAGVVSGKYPKPVRSVRGVDYWDGKAIHQVWQQRKGVHTAPWEVAS